MDRRQFVLGLVATAGGLLVPGPLVVPERRVWALGRWHTPAEMRWIEAVSVAMAEVFETQRQRREWAEGLRTMITLGVEDGAWRTVEPI